MESDKKKNEKGRKQCPVKGKSYLSQMAFAWTLPIFVMGSKKVFTTEDLYEPLRSHKSGNIEFIMNFDTTRLDKKAYKHSIM